MNIFAKRLLKAWDLEVFRLIFSSELYRKYALAFALIPSLHLSQFPIRQTRDTELIDVSRTSDTQSRWLRESRFISRPFCSMAARKHRTRTIFMPFTFCYIRCLVQRRADKRQQSSLSRIDALTQSAYLLTLRLCICACRYFWNL